MSDSLLPPDYEPTEKEEFMNPIMTAYFRKRLDDWKKDLLSDSSETLNHLQEESLHQPDLTDRASIETEQALELRTRDRQRKLVSKINKALHRIDEGEFGYCEDTGDQISIKRLIARPIATFSLEAQERHERYERSHRDDDE